MTTYAITRPRLYVVIIQDKPGDIERLVQLFISVLLWVWLHRIEMLQFVETVNKVGDMISAGREAYLALFKVMLLPVRFQVGIG